MPSKEDIELKEYYENLYEFKVIKRILKMEYPWIKDIRVHSDITSYTRLFLEIEVDPIKLMKEMGYKKMSDWAQLCYDRGDYYNSGYFSVMFNGSDSDDKLHDDSERVKDDMQKIIDNVTKSEVIPVEYKVDRYMSVNDFYFN